MDETPTKPRAKWLNGRKVFNALGRSPRIARKIRIGGIAKSERKNTASPAGIGPAALISVSMATKIATDVIL